MHHLADRTFRHGRTDEVGTWNVSGMLSPSVQWQRPASYVRGRLLRPIGGCSGLSFVAVRRYARGRVVPCLFSVLWLPVVHTDACWAWGAATQAACRAWLASMMRSPVLVNVAVEPEIVHPDLLPGRC
jgi:hypothetical protein